MAAGTDDYLAKPVRPAELAAALSRTAVSGSAWDDEPAHDAPVDTSVLLSLTERLGDRGAQFREKLISTWERDTTTQLHALDEAVEAADRDAVARIAHSMRGGSAALGAVHLSSTCGEVEHALRADDPIDLRDARRRIREEAERARRGLADLRTG